MRAAALLLLLSLAACAGGSPGVPPAAEPSPAQRERAARRSLEDARRLIAEGRLDAAERTLRRGLDASPDDAALHHALAGVLARLERPDEAASHRERARVLAPPPPPPPATALVPSAEGLLLVLLPPDPGREDPERVAPDWPRGEVANTLEARLHTRLPGAALAHADPRTVATASAWLARRRARRVLSLRVERAFCSETTKDGAFALARLRVAAERAGAPGRAAVRFKHVVERPDPGSCRREALARALEGALALPQVEALLAGPEPGDAPFDRVALRALFPGIASGVAAELAAGRRWLAAGHLEPARQAFARALAIDPGDPNAAAYLGEAETTLAMARELSSDVSASAESLRLDPRPSDAQRAAAEVLLAEERRRREALVAALAVLDEDLRAPPSETLKALRPTPVPEDGEFGARVANERAAGAIEARAAYAPDGSVLARYYFARGSDRPLVREEDTSGDGVPDRWIGYADAARREIWEDGRGRGQPDRHFVFAPGGAELERIEVDTSGDGFTDRVFRYERGRLTAESRDTDGDGALDRFDRLDGDGNVDVREEDLDGDGRVDVRSVYRAGKLVRRELRDPALVPDGS